MTDVLVPPIGLILGKVDFANLFINLSDKPYASLAAAREAGAPVIAYGTFVNNLIDFVIVAFVLFLLVREINRIKRAAEGQQQLRTPQVAAAPSE